MDSKQRTVLLVVVLAIIGFSIWALEGRKVTQEGGNVDVVEVTPSSFSMDLEKKAKMFDPAKEITTPDGFINTDAITISEFVGKKVVLIDFWTYSCINCQRTTPYLNAWWDKYEDEGLVIIGIHTPEFEFEKNYDNVKAAVEEFGIKFPVVLDNDYSTWRAYQNRYWPRKYLVDIDGFVVYDHIGEGGYEETEAKIQQLLKERAKTLGEETVFDTGYVDVTAEKAERVDSPEVYFGAARNSLLENGVPHLMGLQQLEIPSTVKKNALYLDGSWRTEDEYAMNESENGRIVFTYDASNVFMVASSDAPVEVIIRRDGGSLGNAAGRDAELRDGEYRVAIQEERLYRLIEDEKGSEEHTIEIIVPEPGLKAFTFTFG